MLGCCEGSGEAFNVGLSEGIKDFEGFDDGDLVAPAIVGLFDTEGDALSDKVGLVEGNVFGEFVVSGDDDGDLLVGREDESEGGNDCGLGEGKND